MTNAVCDICKKEGLHGFMGFFIDGEIKHYCPAHVSDAPVKRGKRGIWDATGQPKDREWLNKKLEMTRSEKKWRKDISSRRTLPNGQVVRVDEKGNRIG